MLCVLDFFNQPAKLGKQRGSLEVFLTLDPQFLRKLEFVNVNLKKICVKFQTLSRTKSCFQSKWQWQSNKMLGGLQTFLVETWQVQSEMHMNCNRPRDAFLANTKNELFDQIIGIFLEPFTICQPFLGLFFNGKF